MFIFLSCVIDAVIFNEYMFASWNDPSFETAVALAPTAKKLGVNPYIVSENIEGGLKYYQMLYKKYGNMDYYST